MGWFDEQIKQRIKNDEAAFCDAFASLADTVMSQRLERAINDNRVKAKNAIDRILAFYNAKTTELPDKISDINDQLEYLMRPTGIMRRNVNLIGAWYKEAYGAMLASKREDGSPVALIPNGFSGYAYYDDKSGRLIKISKKNADVIFEEAICFYKPLPLGKLTSKDLWKYMLGCISGFDVSGLCVAAFASAAAGLLIPKINSVIYSDVVTGSSMRLLLSVFTFLLCVGVSQLLITTVQTVLSETIGRKMSNSVHTAIMMRLLALPASFFKKKSAGELASSITYVGESITALANSLFTVGLTAVFSLVYVTQMLNYGHEMVAPVMCVLLFVIVFSAVSAAVEVRVTQKLVKAEARENGITYSFITGIQKIKLSGAEKRAFSKWALAYKSVSELKHNPPIIMKLGNVVFTCIPLVGIIVIYYYAIKSGAALSDYFAFSAAYGFVMGAFSELIGVFRLYARIKPMLAEVSPILSEEPEVARNKAVVSRLMGGIEINNVSFRYSEDMPYVIDNISLKIRPGQYVALVGKSGCGKSTLMRLLLGFEKASRGAIYYDGKDISSLDLKSLRQNIGTVMQNERLFQGDIFSNIVISSPKATLDDAWKAAEMAGIADDIRLMPMGMNTIISEGGGSISGGQRQRIIIARAICSSPKILMFDEATSALDNLTQKTVSESLKGLKCTRLVIAHRLSTIKDCDRIVVLNGGKIIEDGKYDELIANKGFFAQLVERQQTNNN